MRIAFLESFYGGSHRAFADGLIAHSRHNWGLFSLPDRHWKWRMHDAAAALTSELLNSGFVPDLVFCTALLDVAAVRGYLHQAGLQAPVVVYFHENQFAYPVSPRDGDRQAGFDNHYAYLNYTSARVADGVVYNSAFNRDSMLEALPAFLRQYPDGYRPHDLEALRQKAVVLPVGLTLLEDVEPPPVIERPFVLWNHRWAHDKGPNLFFETLMALSEEGLQFDLAVAGPATARAPEIFARAEKTLHQHIVHWGSADGATYRQLLQTATLLPVTSHHDFFGIAVLEAVAAGVRPLLPKRLAYPEHFNLPELFWESEEAFVDQLRNALLHPTPCPTAAQIAARNYAWANVAPRFDLYFDSFAP